MRSDYSVSVRHSEQITLVIVENPMITVELHWGGTVFDGIGVQDKVFNRASWVYGLQFGRTWEEVEDETATALFPDAALTSLVLGFIHFGPGC